MRTDPAETGGLFIGRRPGTEPIRYEVLPVRGGALRQHGDDLLSLLLLAGIFACCVLCWGPIPVACLWVGSRVNYATGSVGLGLAVSFVLLFVLLFGAVAAMKRVDTAWLLVRRAAGHDQRTGVATRIFALTAFVVAVVFTIWFFVFHGPGATNRPSLEYHG